MNAYLLTAMNLAIVSPFPPAVTGIGQYGYHISRGLERSGQFRQITVLAGAPDVSQKVNVSPSLTVDFAWRPNQLSAGSAVLSALRRLNPDLVWYNLGVSVFGRSPLANLFGFLSLGQVRLAGLPTVVTLHELVELSDLKTLHAPGGSLAWLGARLLTNLATRADMVCFTMRRYVEWFSSRYPDRDCMHIPIGAYRTPERLPESDVPELLFFTTLAPYKGLEILLAAYRSLLPQFPTLRLTIAGAEHPRFPGYRDQLQRDHSSLSGIHWLGQVPEECIRSMFSQAQVIVLPYTASTGSSSVLYQAAMWGRALVASDLLETRSVAAESGLAVNFFENRDFVSLAKAIQSVLESPARRRAQVAHNYSVIKHNRLEETCRLYLQAFNQALASQHKDQRIDIPSAIPMELT